MSQLTEVAPGLWVQADQVLAIRTTRERTIGTLTLRPSVTLHLPGCSDIGWELDTWEDAVAWARQLANTIKAAPR